MALYGTFLYGGAHYGVATLPVSVPWDIFDFCEPTDATMLLLLGYPEVTAARFGGAFSWFNVNNDYCMASSDGVDSGLRVDVPVSPTTFSLQFSILPTALPDDFSAIATNRVFFGVFNKFGKTVGLYLSENGGIALGDGAGSYTVFVDSADIFAEGLDYYIFRVTVNESTGRANLYVTRKDVYAATAVHQLRYTFTPLDTPTTEVDNVRIEIYGTGADPTQICLDCLRLASTEVIANRRPVAVIADDQARVLTQYGYFDGRGSYDPDTPPAALRYHWTLEDAPESSSLWVSGAGVTPADASGYTNIITGPASTFSAVLEGDLLVGDIGSSTVMRVAADGSWLALVNDVMAASGTPTWRVLSQSCWGGARLAGTVMQDVLNRQNVPPGVPTVGDAYLVTSVAAGAWAGHEGEIATWGGAVWAFTSPAANQMVFVVAELESYRTSGGGPPVWWISDPKPWELSYWEGRAADVGVILADVLGLHTVSLLVNDGVRDSLPVEALLNVYQNNIPLGLTPDLSFIWNYLSDFWPLVENRERAETFWSATAQLVTDELMKLWQYGYHKGVMDIQRTFQRRWLNYDPWYEEPNYEELPAAVENGVNGAGYATTPTPVPLPAPELPVDPEYTYAFDAGTVPANTGSAHYLVLEGIGYRIARVRGDNVITSDPLPTTDRPHYWMIRPSVTSRVSNFTGLGVSAGDAAVFEVRTEDGDIVEVSTYIWGVRGAALLFEDRLVSGYIAGTGTYTTRFKGVLRRTAIAVDDLVVSMPRLQEVINYHGVDGAPSPLFEGLDFRIEEVTTVEAAEINTIQMTDSWFPSVLQGFAGSTSGIDHEYFYDLTVDFEDAFGAGADLRGYVLELADGTRYRLYQVISATQIELEDEALAFNLAGQRWWIRRIDDPPDHLWAEITYLDNRPEIESFGRLVGFSLDHLEERTDNLDYLSAVQGLWYYVWGGRTLFRTRVGSQIILGLPFSEVAGTITDIQEPFDATRSRIIIQDTDNEAIYRTYLYPTALGIATNPDTDVDYVLGDTVAQFAPLSEGVVITDYIEDPDWFEVFVGSGDFYEPQKVHTWGVIIDADAFDLINLLFLVDYLRKYKPKHTDPFFALVKTLTQTINVADPMLMGPVIPAGYTFPDAWPPYTYPPTWADSPHDPPRAAITDHYPTTPPVPTFSVEFGGLRLSDVSGPVPDGTKWSWADGETHVPTRSEGVFRFDDTDESGHCIHRFDDHLNAVNLFAATDGDMETPGTADWPTVDVGGMGFLVPAKVVGPAPVHGGVQSLYLASANTHTGVEQKLVGALDTGWQVAARLWVYLVAGQAYFRILDQDAGQTVLAEWRHGTAYAQWHQLTLHAWRTSAQGAGNTVTFQALTGPAGGEFYLDDVGLYEKQMPWSQWGFDRSVSGRTGGYTTGGLPDEDLQLQLAIPVP